MNKIGLVGTLFAVMFAIVIFILALALAPVVKTFIDNSRNTTTFDGAQGLDCANTSISDFDKATCVASDLYIPAFVGILLGIAGIIIGAKVLIK